MVTKPISKPVEDSVAKVNDEVAVGEDLDFQRKWWRFENAAWVVFTLIIVLDLAGLFGRGPIAKAERHSADGAMDVKYERIERTNSPSILTIQFAQSAIQNGKIHVSDRPGLGVEIDMGQLERAHALYNEVGLGARDDARAMQFFIPGWQFDNKRPCMVR